MIGAMSAPATPTPDTGRLATLDELGDTGVTVVQHPDHGALAVGMSGDEPFAVSNRCRHLFASLGEGHVAEDGCLECPWHGARYDVRTGQMTVGPGGAFRPASGLIKGTMGRRKLATYPVEVRDGAIWLTA
jgi:nitrite reductase/ring-hydroxylating ferredoxin subunit